MNLERVELILDGPVARVWMNRPDARNAFDGLMVTELRKVLFDLRSVDAIRVIVLGGRGPSFCAGADLAWMKAMASFSRAENLAEAQAMADLFFTVYESPKPVVARVHGHALGGGAGLVAACDIPVAALGTQFGFTEVRLGIIPAVISPYVVSRIGESAARELFLTGERIEAVRAQEIGLVRAAVPEEDLDTLVEGRVAELLKAGPRAMAEAKALIREVAWRRIEDVQRYTVERIADVRVSAEGQEGMRAFLEKRKPDWDAVTLFRKVLIANRGEIAVRVARTCRAMGIRTAAVYSEPDRDALHTREADEAHLIGPAEAARSYLDIDAIVSAARRSGADAIHPGYGFLSQNGDFADAVAKAGLAFIGPPGPVHRLMGDKKGARRLMASSSVPVLPGYDGDAQDDATLTREAARIGWPVMIKPSRGGGGKGMRVVRSAADFPGALAASRREARSAFGDDAMVLERFVERPRHVEVQVMADGRGAVLHLLERECSIQRRHQKVVEETPSPALTEEQRRALCEAGVAAARAAGYVNAGTVEFLLDPAGRFYFLEMNTRLQVEHPVTEAVTGLDLVRMQIEIAAGRPLAIAQGDVIGRGHALETRLYAEDPDRDDLPSPGRVLHLAAPEGPGVRFDSGIAAGSEVTVFYDPLLAKIVTWGRDRTESIERMSAALERTAVLGVVTNLARLRAIVAHPAFVAGDLHTGFVDEHLRETRAPSDPPPLALAAAQAALRLSSRTSARVRTAAPDPWTSLGSWRIGGAS